MKEATGKKKVSVSGLDVRRMGIDAKSPGVVIRCLWPEKMNP